MDKTTAPGSSGGAFVDKTTLVAGTKITAADLNAHQNELYNAIAGAGLTPASGDLTQLLQAIRLVGGKLDTDGAMTANDNTRVPSQAAVVTKLGSFTPTGVMYPYAGRAAPSGFLLCDGSAISRSTYGALFAVLNPTLGAVSITIASPGVATLNGHGLVTGDTVFMTTSGALPTGLAPATIYWVTVIDANTFKFATSYANAVAATNINTSGTQSGTHTLGASPWGIGDGSTTFNVPDTREAALRGAGTRAAGVTAHDTFPVGAFKDDQMQGHFHSTTAFGAGGGGGYTSGGQASPGAVGSPTTDGVNGTPRTGTTTRGKSVGVNYIVKT